MYFNCVIVCYFSILDSCFLFIVFVDFLVFFFFFFKQKTAYEMRISDWSSDVCSSDLPCKLHMKLIVVDDAVYVGSANFDMRSLFLNLEIMQIGRASCRERVCQYV